ncbi:hypothetical protein BH23BAC3_BH23BAC3_24260 [soil metagenome]
MTDAFNNINQLPLFSRETMILTEGYRNLEAFRFEEAKRYFNDVLETEPESVVHEAASRGLKLCSDWQPLVSRNNNSELSLSVDISRLYNLFRNYDFANIAGEQQFQEALFLTITELMLEKGRFYTGEGNETIADLLCKLGRHRKAEEVVLEQMEMQPEDHHFYYLAQIQWQFRKRGEAKKNYTLGLLHNPCGLPLKRVEYQNLKNLIQTEGPEMAPAFGWVRGILPMVPLHDDVNICSAAHRQAVDCYRLLWRADRAVRNYNMEACVEYRKKLKAEAPALYDEYFALLRGN